MCILHPLTGISLPPFGSLSGNFIACQLDFHLVRGHSFPLSPGEDRSHQCVGGYFASAPVVCTSVNVTWRAEWVFGKPVWMEDGHTGFSGPAVPDTWLPPAMATWLSWVSPLTPRTCCPWFPRPRPASFHSRHSRGILEA